MREKCKFCGSQSKQVVCLLYNQQCGPQWNTIAIPQVASGGPRSNLWICTWRESHSRSQAFAVRQWTSGMRPSDCI